jgi:glycosyl-4,4'-diaponeurosporenoate acyltransferase
MIFHFSVRLALLVNFMAWLIIHITISRSIATLRPESFNPKSWLHKKRSWEKDGRIYQAFFKIKKWKKFLPDGAAFYKNGFRKKVWLIQA